MSQTDQIDSAQTDNCVATEHDRVFYKTSGDKRERGEFEVAEIVADAFPDFSVIVDMTGSQSEKTPLWWVDVNTMTTQLYLHLVSPLDEGFAEILVDLHREMLLNHQGAKSFEDIIWLLDRIAEGDDSGWAPRFALQGDDYTLDDGTSVWVGAPEEIDEPHVFVGLKHRSGSYKLVDDGAEDTLREALPQ